MTKQNGTSGDDSIVGVDAGGIVTVSQTPGVQEYAYGLIPVWGNDNQHVFYTVWNSANQYTSTVYMKDLTTGAMTLVSADSNGKAVTGYYYSASSDGTKVAFQSFDQLVAGASAYHLHTYVKTLTTGTVTLAETDAQGNSLGDSGSSDPVISPDGTKVAFVGPTGSLIPGNAYSEIIVKDLKTGAATVVTRMPA